MLDARSRPRSWMAVLPPSMTVMVSATAHLVCGPLRGSDGIEPERVAGPEVGERFGRCVDDRQWGPADHGPTARGGARRNHGLPACHGHGAGGDVRARDCPARD